ncbi:MAG: 4-hydroxy-2-oxo-heptane-1,7-dioate aldolase [Alcaligenaceae bacterium]|nr:4-hydroxy-2-oxo-heptane-1,7-dioate aldolase [Alcaligenaceae bacterium]
MTVPINRFKRALAAGQHQLGLWVSMCSPYAAEVVAGSGFDWLLFDTEHAPNDLQTVLGQLQASAPYPVSGIVRPTWNDPLQIKRYLDIGVQTLLIPYVQNAEEAAKAVAAMRYPPKGTRGVGGTQRASAFGRNPDYMKQCEDELCLLVQVETVEALNNLDAILAVDGVDGVFIGPADLSASMGYPGNMKHPQVQATIEDTLRRIKASGKAPGILSFDETLCRRYMELGTLFTAVGMDLAILASETTRLAARYKAST